MSKTLECSNPSCKQFIPIPEGALQVVCPSCHTWHFPSTEEQKNETPLLSPSDHYPIPSIPDTNNNPDNSSGLPDYPGVETPPIPSTPTPSSTSIAYLKDRNGSQYSLKEGKNIIGRKEGDVILNDKTISRQHCVIEVLSSIQRGWEYYIYDYGYMGGNGSTNGVLISGRSLRLENHERLRIGNGTTIELGNVSLVLVYS